MTLATAPSAVVLNYQLESQFQQVRQRLSQLPPGPWQEQPLAYWVMPADRRLPRAFLGYKIGQLTETPYAELAATAGVGPKKLAALLTLLERVVFDTDKTLSSPPDGPSGENRELVRAAAVSEAVWEQWRETVRHSGLKDEPLGRFADSLQDLPRVIWHVPLARYLPLSLADLRALKTHGQKRVQAVLDVFATVAQSAPQGSTSFGSRLLIRPLADVEQWVRSVALRSGSVSPDEIRARLLLPLYRQLQIDVGEQIAGLVANRLGLFEAEAPVAEAARRLGVTRARVYQLLAEAAAALAVRWPDGPSFALLLSAKLGQEPGSAEQVAAFNAAARLLFPGGEPQAAPPSQPPTLRLPRDERRAAGPPVDKPNPAPRLYAPRSSDMPDRSPPSARRTMSYT